MCYFTCQGQKKLPFVAVLTWFLILEKIQDGHHVWWRHRPPSAPPPIKYTSSCWSKAFHWRQNSFEILQHAIWICVYVRGLMKSLQRDFTVVKITDHAVCGGFNFWVWKWNPWVWPLKWKPLSSSIFPVVLFIVMYNVGVNVNEILKSSHSNIIAAGYCK